MSNPFEGLPSGYAAQQTPTASPPAVSFNKPGGMQRPPPPSLEGLGSTELTQRNPGFMQGFKEWHASNPSAPTEYAYELQLVSTIYFVPNSGEPTFIPTFEVLSSNCPLDPQGSKRIVFMSGSYDQKKGGMARLLRPMLSFLVSMLGIDQNLQKDAVATVKRIADPLMKTYVLEQGALVGTKVRLAARLNAKGYIDTTFSPHEASKTWSPKLAEAIASLLKASAGG